MAFLTSLELEQEIATLTTEALGKSGYLPIIQARKDLLDEGKGVIGRMALLSLLPITLSLIGLALSATNHVSADRQHFYIPFFFCMFLISAPTGIISGKVSKERFLKSQRLTLPKMPNNNPTS